MGRSVDRALKVLCVAGSPRRQGNSARLLSACIEGIREVGATPDLLDLAATPIPGCTGCNGCSATGMCAQGDPMTPVYERIDSASALVIASPVYFASVPSSLKAFLDRFQPYWVRRYLLHQQLPGPRRPAALLLVGGGGDPFGTRCAVTPVQSALAVAGFEVGEPFEVLGPDARGDIEALTDSLDAAREVGRGLIRGLTERA
ncbi:MAG: flavodoxin family protein [Actinobacteria bacterium HGW-Actinobacteria-10]|jgi:multimeric flavodoxin WrbA|nr:MAG: flavodoxin family protein [Actinobacteria bacterium HGW-Actinobacteria-10]